MRVNQTYWGIFIPGLTLMFIYLKLTGVIMWSWWWVLAPLWGPLAFVLLFLLIILVFAAIFSKN
jgi:hypothetical protein